MKISLTQLNKMILIHEHKDSSIKKGDKNTRILNTVEHYRIL